MSSSQKMVFLLLAAICLQSAVATVIPGDADCACIDPWTKNLTKHGASLNVATACPWSGNGTCYPTTYGALNCSTHDEFTPICKVGSAPTWCSISWCYVDPQKCARPHGTSKFFGDIIMGHNGRPLSYSYATCGNLNYYSRGDPELRNLGRKLRVSWATIGISSNPSAKVPSYIHLIVQLCATLQMFSAPFHVFPSFISCRHIHRHVVEWITTNGDDNTGNTKSKVIVRDCATEIQIPNVFRQFYWVHKGRCAGGKGWYQRFVWQEHSTVWFHRTFYVRINGLLWVSKRLKIVYLKLSNNHKQTFFKESRNARTIFNPTLITTVHPRIGWEFVEISAESLAAHYGDTSAITACVHEVAINRTDMCWFDSWLLGKIQICSNVFKCVSHKSFRHTAFSYVYSDTFQYIQWLLG